MIWGSLHGLAQIAEDSFIGHEEVHGLKRAFRVVCVFVFCVILWVFFRAQTLNEAMYVFNHMFEGISNLRQYFLPDMRSKRPLYTFLFGGFVTALYDYISFVKGEDAINLLNNKNVFARWFAYIALGLTVIIFSAKGAATEFVYFQF